MTPEFETLLEAGTAVIADVFDSLGWTPSALDTNLFPVKGPGTEFIGPAYTVSGESHSWTGGGDRAKLSAIDAMTPGVVPVWAGNDIRGVCCFGDLLVRSCGAVTPAGEPPRPRPGLSSRLRFDNFTTIKTSPPTPSPSAPPATLAGAPADRSARQASPRRRNSPVESTSPRSSPR